LRWQTIPNNITPIPKSISFAAGLQTTNEVAAHGDDVDEITHYCRLAQHYANQKTPPSLTTWWNAHKNDLPNLYPMAMNILTNWGSSSESERIFSLAKRIQQGRENLAFDVFQALVLGAYFTRSHDLKKGYKYLNKL